ncbi:MAG: glucoamylase family protein [Betaproteobacteria bacterium]
MRRFLAYALYDRSTRTLSHELPLRSELFSADQMEQHGKSLAAAHKLTFRRGADQLLARLAANETVLIDACNVLTAAVRADRRITPAGEWLLDNFYLIEEQIRTAKRHLPEGYSRELPRLAAGASAGLPRVYDIALETIAHGDGRVDPESLTRFVVAYQTVTPVKLGELWAIPIMLRLALIENLRRVAADVAAGRVDRDLADGWADQMKAIAQSDPKSLILVIADMARSNPPMTTAFVSELSRRLQGQGPALALPLTWIEQRLSESHITIEQLVQSGTQQQAANQVSISNSIGSLRFLGAMDWRRFVEAMSVVEHKLLEDPAGTYGRMDFVTRDRYRHAVEELAKQSPLPEVEVARRAIWLSRESAARSDADPRSAHVGYYLIDAGRPRLERAINLRRSSAATLTRLASRSPSFVYLGAVLTLTGLFSAGMASMAQAGGLSRPMLALMVVLSLVATSQLAVALVNWSLTLLVTPRTLPRMELSAGIPPESRTLVAVPTMLASAQGIEDLVEALEVRFLANQDANLHFALLTDFRDAGEETRPDDADLLRLAQARIDALNDKYGPARVTAAEACSGDIFYLLHRPRVWNPRERRWMGYERKRGKLADLNALLRGKDDATRRFSTLVGDIAALTSVKYVITLDTDTELPRDSARQLVGAMAHPLNRARYDAIRKRVTSGYGILQPRVVTSVPGSNRSRFARLFGGESGIDPYTRTVSDVYQDGFGEGSFVGKGIYDVDAFELALGGRFPENRILSHDLLEGCYARSGLITDVQLYEDYPSRYSADVSRRCRWIRGDWQIAGWLSRRVPGVRGARETNPLSLLSQWKLFDNLRRSLVPPALLLLLLAGWTILAPAWGWTVAALGILVVPPLIASLLDLVQRPADVPLGQHLVFTFRTAARRSAQIAFSLACLPYEAWFSAGAIVRTHWRTLVTHRRLLEWTESSEERHRDPATLAASFRSMWVAPTVAVGAAFGVASTHPDALAVAAPILLLWLAAPVLAWWISRPLAPRVVRLTLDQTVFLRKLARRTWAYFEIFVGPADHWLPPDNYQEVPVDRIAHRTSPTNMGMALLADLAAYDFGFLPAGRLVERIGNTLRTMQSLERHQGHFYNWYDTQSLQPLAPRYISSVDSGNLAGHLLTLRAGLLVLPADRILEQRLFAGFIDTVRVLVDTFGAEVPAAILQLGRELDSAYDAWPVTVDAAHRWLDRLAATIGAVDGGIAGRAGTDEAPAAANEARAWMEALAVQCRSALDELMTLAPWLQLPALEATLAEFPVLASIPTLRELADLMPALTPQIDRLRDSAATSATRDRLDELARLAGAASVRAQERIVEIERIASQCEQLAHMDSGVLYDRTRHLFAVGYNVDERQRDPSFYDLLASEARLPSFVAIALGQVPQETWFALGRLLTSAAGRPILLSWSGSMFEYLMPLLVMPTYENTLLDETCRAAVERQIAYGKQLGVPWGMSEAGYNTVDASLNYQYRAFGVPGLGLKRGLAEDVVVAPYASVLALMVAPEAACLNLQRLAAEGLAGRFGLYEAIDYTPARLPRGQASVVVRSFMAHHQGMSVVALGHLLLDRPMQKRFESDPLFQATLLLLQERIPKSVTFFPHVAQLTGIRATVSEAEMPVRVIARPDTLIPEVQLLSNGRYHVMVTNSGGGSSRWKDLAITRWREDATCDNWGTFCYLRDVASGEFWSTAHQPTGARADHYEAIFSEGRAEFRRRDHGLDVHTEIAVSPEDDIELRRVRIVNRSRVRKVIELTSYAEIVLAPPAAEAIHPAFSNLFVQTEIAREKQAILCTRRPRSPDEQAPWVFHLMAVHGTAAVDVSYETDRMRFVGRGNTPAAPEAMRDPSPLSGSEGSVLDPIAAIRTRVTLEPEETATIDMVYGVAETREAAIGLVEKYQDPRLADRVVELAWTHAQVVLRQINATEADARLYARLANSIIFANASLRADAGVIARNRRGQSGLWGYAISGDLPIVLLRIADAANIDLVRQLVQAHAYWRLKGLPVDLVIWNEDHGGYRQLLQDQIMGLIAARVEGQMMNRPGGIFVRRGDQISEEDRVLLESVARAIVSDGKGTLAEQIAGRALLETRAPRLVPEREHRIETVADDPPARALILENGLGGFTPDGSEYVITTDRDRLTPAPWVNVLANPHFGTVVSESGGSYTWSENAHEFRLTPWNNDPVSDAGGEAFYLRDEESGHFWSATPLPARGRTPYVTRHGFGYTVFEHGEDGIFTELWIHVAPDAAVKFSTLKVRNASGRARRISITGYVEWVLGDLRPKSVMHVVTESDGKTGAIFARNPYSAEFGDRVAFFDVDDTTRTLTCNRAEFIGRNGTLATPAAMTRTRLSGKSGPALDPCAAIQVTLELDAGVEREATFRLGVGRDTGDARSLVHRFRGAMAARSALEEGRRQWQQTLGAVRVETPDESLDVLCNGWLVYQTLACRLWARSGFYQSGGAFGFRDQLQDVLALVHAEPDLTRAHLLLCASRQFVEGDVQHWWHPPSGRGVRTQCSDDYLWLPVATARYVLATGDTGVLDEPVTFLDGRPVNPGEDSYYDLPGRSADTASLYEHGVRAVLHGLRFGSHGLPLMGSGDWNDGMNLVGIDGKGESVWLAFFLCAALAQFGQVARLRGDMAFAQRCDDESVELRGNIERHGWDGAWYRRAYFDDGSPLGSAGNAECQIDSIAQSWSVLSGSGNPTRARTAMNAVYQRLVRRDDALIQLLAPPFDRSTKHPGYIKGYVPGIRENGGQYTHGAIWSVMAFAALGDAPRAWELMDMINPVNHGRTAEGVATYRVEPYVVAADVYATPPHTGRGGWSWYTGSAGWMYRLIVESLLGLQLEGDRLRLAPCLPAAWAGFKLHYRYRTAVYHITVLQIRSDDPDSGATTVSVDGVAQPDAAIPLVDDGSEHAVEVRLVTVDVPESVPVH